MDGLRLATGFPVGPTWRIFPMAHIAASPHVAADIDTILLWVPEEWIVFPDHDACREANDHAERWLEFVRPEPPSLARDTWLAKLAPGLWASYPFPLAEPRRLSIPAATIIQWTHHDDQLENRGMPSDYPERVRAAITDTVSADPSGDRYLWGWQQIGRSARDIGAMSPQWIGRFAEDIAAAYAATNPIVETNRIHTWTTDIYTTLRLPNTGQAAWLDLIEYTHGRELSPDQHASEPVQTVVAFISGLFAIFNDLVGVDHDLATDLPNLVTLTVREQQLTYAQAARQLAAEYRARLQRFATDLTLMRSRHPDLAWWFDLVGYFLAGEVHAHILAPRYNPVQVMPDGSSLRVRSTFPDGYDVPVAPIA